MAGSLSMWIFLILWALPITAAADDVNMVKLVATNCPSESCMELRKSNDTDGLTWDESKKYCQELGKQLLLITDSSVQQRVESLLQRVAFTKDMDGVWVDGERIFDSRWMRINDQPFTEQITNRVIGGRCVGASNKEYIAYQCTDRETGSEPLCETKTTNGVCTFKQGHSSVSINDVCYYLSVNKMDAVTWYEAQTYCWEQFGGDLAYTDVDSTRTLERIPNGRDVWLGVFRHPWFSGDTWLHYYNWDEGHPALVITGEERVFLTSEGKWGSDVGDTKRHYFVCSGSGGDELPSTTKERTTTTRATSTTPFDDSDTSVTSVAYPDSSTTSAATETPQQMTPEDNLIVGTSSSSSGSFSTEFLLLVIVSVLALIVVVSIAVNIFLGIRARRLQEKLKQANTTESGQNARKGLGLPTSVIVSQPPPMTSFSASPTKEYEDVADFPLHAASAPSQNQMENCNNAAYKVPTTYPHHITGPRNAGVTPGGTPNASGHNRSSSDATTYEKPSTYANATEMTNVYDSLQPDA